MNKERLEALFTKYSKLETVIAAGTISLKMVRNILNVDRWIMQDIFQELLEIRAVFACGPAAWRATPELKEYLEAKRNDK